MKDTKQIVYSLNIEDIQNVATEEFGRTLTKYELEIIEDKIGDYIQWYDIIKGAISNHLEVEHPLPGKYLQ